MSRIAEVEAERRTFHCGYLVLIALYLATALYQLVLRDLTLQRMLRH